MSMLDTINKIAAIYQGAIVQKDDKPTPPKEPGGEVDTFVPADPGKWLLATDPFGDKAGLGTGNFTPRIIEFPSESYARLIDIEKDAQKGTAWAKKFLQDANVEEFVRKIMPSNHPNPLSLADISGKRAASLVILLDVFARNGNMAAKEILKNAWAHAINDLLKDSKRKDGFGERAGLALQLLAYNGNEEAISIVAGLGSLRFFKEETGKSRPANIEPLQDGKLKEHLLTWGFFGQRKAHSILSSTIFSLSYSELRKYLRLRAEKTRVAARLVESGMLRGPVDAKWAEFFELNDERLWKSQAQLLDLAQQTKFSAYILIAVFDGVVDGPVVSFLRSALRLAIYPFSPLFMMNMAPLPPIDPTDGSRSRIQDLRREKWEATLTINQLWQAINAFGETKSLLLGDLNMAHKVLVADARAYKRKEMEQGRTRGRRNEQRIDLAYSVARYALVKNPSLIDEYGMEMLAPFLCGDNFSGAAALGRVLERHGVNTRTSFEHQVFNIRGAFKERRRYVDAFHERKRRPLYPRPDRKTKGSGSDIGQVSEMEFQGLSPELIGGETKDAIAFLRDVKSGRRETNELNAQWIRESDPASIVQESFQSIYDVKKQMSEESRGALDNATDVVVPFAGINLGSPFGYFPNAERYYFLQEMNFGNFFEGLRKIKEADYIFGEGPNAYGLGTLIYNNGAGFGFSTVSMEKAYRASGGSLSPYLVLQLQELFSAEILAIEYIQINSPSDVKYIPVSEADGKNWSNGRITLVKDGRRQEIYFLQCDLWSKTSIDQIRGIIPEKNFTAMYEGLETGKDISDFTFLVDYLNGADVVLGRRGRRKADDVEPHAVAWPGRDDADLFDTITVPGSLPIVKILPKNAFVADDTSQAAIVEVLQGKELMWGRSKLFTRTKDGYVPVTNVYAEYQDGKIDRVFIVDGDGRIYTLEYERAGGESLNQGRHGFVKGTKVEYALIDKGEEGSGNYRNILMFRRIRGSNRIKILTPKELEKLNRKLHPYAGPPDLSLPSSIGLAGKSEPADFRNSVLGTAIGQVDKYIFKQKIVVTPANRGSSGKGSGAPFEIEVYIGVDRQEDLEKNLGLLIVQLKDIPTIFLRATKWLHIFQNKMPGRAGRNLEIAIAVYDFPNLTRYGNFKPIFLHEVAGHQFHRKYGFVKLFDRIILAIAAGGADTDEFLERRLGSAYHRESYTEYIAQAAAFLGDPDFEGAHELENIGYILLNLWSADSSSMVQRNASMPAVETPNSDIKAFMQQFETDVLTQYKNRVIEITGSGDDIEGLRGLLDGFELWFDDVFKSMTAELGSLNDRVEDSGDENLRFEYWRFRVKVHELRNLAGPVIFLRDELGRRVTLPRTLAELRAEITETNPLGEFVEVTTKLGTVRGDDLQIGNWTISKEAVNYLLKKAPEPELLRDVLKNLVVNAGRVADKGEISLVDRAALRQMETPKGISEEDFDRVRRNPGGWVAIVVEDNGPGIPPNVQEKLFRELLVHGDPETEGTGEGLYVGKKAIESEKVGGLIGYETREGGPTRFYVILPKKGNILREPGAPDGGSAPVSNGGGFDQVMAPLNSLIEDFTSVQSFLVDFYMRAAGMSDRTVDALPGSAKRMVGFVKLDALARLADYMHGDDDDNGLNSGTSAQTFLKKGTPFLGRFGQQPGVSGAPVSAIVPSGLLFLNP